MLPPDSASFRPTQMRILNPMGVHDVPSKVSTHHQAIVGILKAIRELMNPPETKKRPIGFVHPEEKK